MWVTDMYKFADANIECHTSNYAKTGGRHIQYVIIHYTGNSSDTAIANGRYFAGANRNASAHYFVDNDVIVQSVPLKYRAWHSGSKSYNEQGIGIEMCCSGNFKVSETTKKRTIGLIVKLFKYLRFTADDVDGCLIRHYDVTGKECPAQMAGKNNPEWEQFKKDVKAAMAEVKEEKRYKFICSRYARMWIK